MVLTQLYMLTLNCYSLLLVYTSTVPGERLISAYTGLAHFAPINRLMLSLVEYSGLNDPDTRPVVSVSLSSKSIGAPLPAPSCDGDLSPTR